MRERYLAGFTMIELLLAMVIIGVLAAITLDLNFSSRKRITALVADTQTLALAIYDMQNRTLSFLPATSPISGHNGYGVYFDLAEPNSFRTFYRTDSPTFNPSDLQSLFKAPTDKSVFSFGNKISKICLNGGTEKCSSNSNFSGLALFFVKPKQYANFYILQNGSFSSKISDLPIAPVCLEITTGQNEAVESRSVTVSYVGQISEKVGPCQ